MWPAELLQALEQEQVPVRALKQAPVQEEALEGGQALVQEEALEEEQALVLEEAQEVGHWRRNRRWFWRWDRRRHRRGHWRRDRRGRCRRRWYRRRHWSRDRHWHWYRNRCGHRRRKSILTSTLLSKILSIQVGAQCGWNNLQIFRKISNRFAGCFRETHKQRIVRKWDDDVWVCNGTDTVVEANATDFGIRPWCRRKKGHERPEMGRME